MSKKPTTTESQQPKAEQLLLDLPYQEITELANRDTLRKMSIQGKQSYHIPISSIVIRERFNVRLKPDDMSQEDWLKHLDIEELALDIAQNGMQEPLIGDLLADGTFVPTDGYRRYLAVNWLLANCHTKQAHGKPMDVIEIVPNPKGTTELDRVIKMLSSDKKLPYTEMELARGVKRMKECFGLTHEEIGTRLGRSRQWVDNKIKLTELPEEKQKAIENGTLKSTNALAESRTPKLNPAGLSDEQRQELKDNFEKPVGAPEVLDYFDNPDDITKTAPVITKTETKAALDEEMKSRATDPNYKENRPKNDRDDALAKIDFKKEKTEAEMELNEVKKMLDQINVICDKFPASMKQTAGDIQLKCVASVRKCEYVQEIIKKAADER